MLLGQSQQETCIRHALFWRSLMHFLEIAQSRRELLPVMQLVAVNSKITNCLTQTKMQLGTHSLFVVECFKTPLFLADF
jgi:hypothetical protein